MLKLDLRKNQIGQEKSASIFKLDFAFTNGNLESELKHK